MVTVPTSAPVIGLGGDAGGGGAGAGAGDGAERRSPWSKSTTVLLSLVTVLPAASWIVAVRTRVAPEVRLVVAPVRAISAAAPWTTVKAPRVPVVRPAAVASIVTEPTSCAGDRLGGDAARRRCRCRCR